MGRPTKPLTLVSGHRTKDELKVRRDAESALITGVPIKISTDVKNNPIASKEFRRIKKLLASIGKDDDLYGQIINTNCLLIAECEQINETKDRFIKTLDEFEDSDEELDYSEKVRMKIKLQDQILSCDKQLMAKRKMILDISKENVMTVQSALRSIPKKPEEKKVTGMAAFMEHRQSGDG